MKKFKVDIVITKTYEFSREVNAADNTDATEQVLKVIKSAKWDFTTKMKLDCK